jgi:hypothetical protein
MDKFLSFTLFSLPRGDDTPWRIIYDNDLTFYYAIFTSIMSALFVGFWKRRVNHLGHLWATASVTKDPLIRRHEFRPTSTFISPITGLVEPQFPTSRRILRFFLSWIVLAIFLVFICASVIAQLIFGKKRGICDFYISNLFSNTAYKGEWLGAFISGQLTSALVGFAGGLLVIVSKLIYDPIILALTNYENHEFTQTHANSLIFKRWILDFANVFSRLLYL